MRVDINGTEFEVLVVKGGESARRVRDEAGLARVDCALHSADVFARNAPAARDAIVKSGVDWNEVRKVIQVLGQIG